MKLPNVTLIDLYFKQHNTKLLAAVLNIYVVYAVFTGISYFPLLHLLQQLWQAADRTSTIQCIYFK